MTAFCVGALAGTIAAIAILFVGGTIYWFVKLFTLYREDGQGNAFVEPHISTLCDPIRKGQA